MGNVYRPRVIAEGFTIAIVASRFNELVTQQLLDGAIDALERHSAEECDYDVYYVPGAFELPAVVRKLADTERYDGILALGVLIRGDTDHYDMLAAEVTKGVAQTALHTDTPVSYGVLTCDTLEQALHRAGSKAGNKGAESMTSLIELINLEAVIAEGGDPEEPTEE
jgi:6,7-dimethyl-8-ribityllumazine synthase